MADCLIAVSEGVRDYLIDMEKLPPENVKTVPNGLDFNHFLNKTYRHELVRQELDITPDNVVVGTIAAFKERKGLSYLVKAAKHVIDKHPQAKFLLVGSGEMENVIRKEIAELALASKFILTGQRSDIPDLLKIMDIFVLPSLWEGLPIAILEAMILERPCVVTDIPAFRNVVIPAVTAHVVPPRDEFALGKAIVDLLNDPQKRLTFGREGRLWVEKNYSAKDMAKRYEEIYEKVIIELRKRQ
jgi:glycosyltransferase involved in cell wall biosynthesis